MKLFYTLVILAILAIGCASSSNSHNKKSDYPHLVSIKSPQKVTHESSKVDIDSVKQIKSQNRAALLLSGSLPDGCTNLGDITQKIKNGKLILKISAWRNPEKMCTQVITPFSYIYNDVDSNKISTRSSIIINGSTYSY